MPPKSTITDETIAPLSNTSFKMPPAIRATETLNKKLKLNSCHFYIYVLFDIMPNKNSKSRIFSSIN